MKTFTIFLLLAAVAVLWLACRGQQAPPLASGIEGRVLIGSTCPVLRDDTPCPDQPYQATIAVWNAERSEKVHTFTTDEGGHSSAPGFANGRRHLRGLLIPCQHLIGVLEFAAIVGTFYDTVAPICRGRSCCRRG